MSGHPTISLICPTRGRPAAFAEMIRSASDTAADPDAVEVVGYVDDDDEMLDDYRVSGYALRTGLVVGGRCTLSDAWNHAAEPSSGDLLMLAADDLRFRTPRWDRIVAAAAAELSDGIGVLYGRDGHADRRMATHPFVTRRWVDIVGRFTAPYFCADYVDLWLHDVAVRVDRLVFLSDVLVEHMHPSFGKGVWDETHTDRLARARAADLPAMWDSLEPERAAEADKLAAVIGRRP